MCVDVGYYEFGGRDVCEVCNCKGCISYCNRSSMGVKFTDGTNEFTDGQTITLKADNTSGVAADKIAPGSQGKLELTVNGSTADVDFDYVIKFAAADSNPLGDAVKFYSTEDHADANEITAAGLTGVIKHDAEAKDKVKTVTIYWLWPVGSDTAIDNDNGVAGLVGNYDITVTATQKVPETTAAPAVE